MRRTLGYLGGSPGIPSLTTRDEVSDTDVQEQAARERPTVAAALETPLVLPVERVIKPSKRRLRLRDFVSDAPIVRVLTARDLKVKYKQSILGPLWLVFQPLALLAAFLVAFEGLAGVETAGLPYVVFALVGLTVWSFFQAAMTIGTASLITNMNLIRFTPCPRLAFPLAAVIASLPAFVVTGTGAVVATTITGHLSPKVLLLPLALLWLLALTLGIVAISSSLAVRYRDVNSALPFLLQVGIFLAPVGYPLSEVSSTARAILDLNPLTGVIEGTRWMVLSGYQPSIEPIVISLAGTALLAVAGWRLFARRETTMADEI
jgi:ABC-type polysaccharide/polyol phosphate export permease